MKEKLMRKIEEKVRLVREKFINSLSWNTQDKSRIITTQISKRRMKKTDEKS